MADSVNPAPRDSPPRSRRRRSWWIAGITAFVAFLVGFAIRQTLSTREGEWLQGHWQHSRSYEDGTIVERHLSFQSNGRVTITNVYYRKSDNAITNRQESAGHWDVRDSQLTIKFDRPIRKDLVLFAAQTRESIRQFLTGTSNTPIDGETSQGRLTRDGPDRFSVQWYDPFARQDSELQAWKRADFPREFKNVIAP